MGTFPAWSLFGVVEGTRVTVTVDGEERTGVVVETAYTVKEGRPVVAVELDERTVVVPHSRVSPSA